MRVGRAGEANGEDALCSAKAASEPAALKRPSLLDRIAGHSLELAS